MKNDINVLQRSKNGSVVLNVALDKFSGSIHPFRLSKLVCLRLQVVEDTNTPTFADEQVNDMGTDETCATGNQRTFLVRTHNRHITNSDDAACRSD